MTLTVVIPSFGLVALLRACLMHLEIAITRAGLVDWRVAVVDNGSVTPYKPDQFEVKGLELIRLDRRTSFSRACNAGAAGPASKCLMFLNNDVLLHPRALAEMFALLAAPGIGICGARLVYPDERMQHCGVRFDGGPRAAHHEFHGWPSASVSRLERHFQAVTAAALLIRGEVFSALGGFDERYPFGYEDVDLCLRARHLGYSITCAQAVDSIHFESTSNQDPRRHDASRALFLERWSNRYTIDGEIPDE